MAVAGTLAVPTLPTVLLDLVEFDEFYPYSGALHGPGPTPALGTPVTRRQWQTPGTFSVNLDREVAA